MAQRSFTVYRTHHGPIVREADGKWIAFALMNKPVEALQQSFLRTKASDYAVFLKVAELKANSSNNTLFADSQGRDRLAACRSSCPRRDDRFDYTKPVDGSDPATDWQGLHALDELPHVLNPPNGWVFNTNNWPWTAAGADSPKQRGLPALHGPGRREPARAARHAGAERAQGLHPADADRRRPSIRTCRRSRG